MSQERIIQLMIQTGKMLTAKFLMDTLHLSDGTIYSQIGKLQQDGYVTSKKVGSTRYYYLAKILSNAELKYFRVIS